MWTEIKISPQDLANPFTFALLAAAKRAQILCLQWIKATAASMSGLKDGQYDVR